MVIVDEQVYDNFAARWRVAEVPQILDNLFFIARMNIEKHTDIFVI
jgi:hypothetical protein